MAAPPPDEAQDKTKKPTYFARLFSEAKEDLSLLDIIIDLVVVIFMTAILLFFRVAESSESRELYYSAILYFILSLISVIVVKVFIVAPYKIIKAQDREKEELEKQLKEKLSREQKGKILHDAIFDLGIRIQELNRGKRYFDLTGEIKGETYQLIKNIYDNLRDNVDIECAGLFWVSKSTEKPLDRFGFRNVSFDAEWCAHLDFIDAHIDALNKIIEFRMKTH